VMERCKGYQFLGTIILYAHTKMRAKSV